MKKLNSKKFLEVIMKKINTIYKCYYEEATVKAKFPYCVVPTLAIRPLNAGYSCIFDIEIFNNEISDISTEKICDDLVNILDHFSYSDNDISIWISLENCVINKSNEQDLSARRVSFEARFF